MKSTPAGLLYAGNFPEQSWREVMSTMHLNEIPGSVANGWHPIGRQVKVCPDSPISESPGKVSDGMMATAYF